MAIPGVLNNEWHGKCEQCIQMLTIAREIIDHAETAGLDMTEKKERCEALLALLTELATKFPGEKENAKL